MTIRRACRGLDCLSCPYPVCVYDAAPGPGRKKAPEAKAPEPVKPKRPPGRPKKPEAEKKWTPERKKESLKMLYWSRRAAGVCTLCGKAPVQEGRVTCAECAVKRYESKAQKRRELDGCANRAVRA